MTPKELLKLASACRKAGITTYRCGDIEFTLGVTEQSKVVNQDKADIQGAVTSDEPSDDDLLMWSVMDVPQADTTSQ